MYEALKIDFNSMHRLAICRPRGPIDHEFAKQLLNFLLALEEASSEPFDRLLDMTLVTEVSLNSAAIYAYADARRKATAHLSQFCTAIIAADPDAESAALLYASLMEGSKIKVGVFHATEPAAHWLDVPLEIVDSHTVHEE